MDNSEFYQQLYSIELDEREAYLEEYAELINSPQLALMDTKTYINFQDIFSQLKTKNND